MEKVLDLYQEPMDINEPLITMDELNKQLTKEVRTPISPQTGSCEKYDFEYERNGENSSTKLNKTYNFSSHISLGVL
jgi:hypothetical protein